jgi:hypothetical protein
MKKTLLAALALTFASSGAWANTLTFQGVTFTTSGSGDTLTLTISNAATGATGDWAGIKYLEAFSIGSVGSFTSANASSFTYEPGQVNNSSADGCGGKGNGWACFFYAAHAFRQYDIQHRFHRRHAGF